MKRWILFVCLVGSLASASATLAQVRDLTLDPAASEVTFILGTTFHTVHGTLAFKAGAIRFDPATGEASGEISVDARQGQTGNDKRDAKMHGEVLESERFPLLVFRPRRLEGTFAESGHCDLRLVGSMTLHGAEHPMTLPLGVDIEDDRVRVVSTFPIPYVEWGMADPSMFIARADKVVEVTVRTAGQLARK